MRTIAILTAAFGLAVLAWAQDAKAIFEGKCATCHGPDGAAKTARGKKMKMKSVKETIAKESAEEMAKAVENGKGVDMPAYGKELAKQQIQAIVEYYRGLAK